MAGVFLFSLLCLLPSVSSLPVLSISVTMLNATCLTTYNTSYTYTMPGMNVTNSSLSSLNSSVSCSSCPVSLQLTYPTPTAATNINCSLIPGFPDSSLYYSYLSSSYMAGNLSLYRSSLNSSAACSAASYLSSFPIATVVQCSNSSYQTQTFNFSTMASISTAALTGSSNTSNASSPFPYASYTLLNASSNSSLPSASSPFCSSNCSSASICPLVNSTVYTNGSVNGTVILPASSAVVLASSVSYTMLTSVSVSSFCPTGCSAAYNAWIDASYNQCMAIVNSTSSNSSSGGSMGSAPSQAQLSCGCTAGNYIGKRMSGCFVSDASSAYLLSVQSSTYSQCWAYFGNAASSSGGSYASGGASAGSSGSSSGVALPVASTAQINQGAIVGGVIGGVVGLILLILILRYCMRMQAKGQGINFHRSNKKQVTLEQELADEGKQLQQQRDAGAALPSATGGDEQDVDDDGEEVLDDEEEEEEEEEEDVEEQQPVAGRTAAPQRR